MPTELNSNAEVTRSTNNIMSILDRVSSGEINLENQREFIEKHIAQMLKEVQRTTAMDIKNSISNLF
jgi:hypothetical protein